MTFRIKRVYEPAAASDGFRVLIDRLWPRGVSKERAELDLWDKEVAPSPALRERWHDSRDRDDTFAGFAAEYQAELDSGQAGTELLAIGREHAVVTLLYGAKDEHVNHARVLLDWLATNGGDAARPDG